MALLCRSACNIRVPTRKINENKVNESKMPAVKKKKNRLEKTEAAAASAVATECSGLIDSMGAKSITRFSAICFLDAYIQRKVFSTHYIKLA